MRQEVQFSVSRKIFPRDLSSQLSSLQIAFSLFLRLFPRAKILINAETAMNIFMYWFCGNCVNEKVMQRRPVHINRSYRTADETDHWTTNSRQLPIVSPLIPIPISHLMRDQWKPVNCKAPSAAA